jgi:hypothetical protein
MKYTFTFGRNSQLIWALILPSFILLIPLLLILEYVLPLYPENLGILSLLATFGYMGFVIWLTLSWVKATTAEVEIAINHDSLQFIFIKKNIFHRSNFTLHFNEIKNIGEDNDKEFDFLYFETKHSSYPKFFIRTNENNPDFDIFGQTIFKMESEFNKQVPIDSIITNKSIYQKWPIMLAAFLFFACWLIFPIVMLLEESSWLMILKYFVFVTVSSPIVLKVYNQNFKH